MGKRLVRIILLVVAVLIVSLIGLGVYANRLVQGSLAKLSGEALVSGIDKPVTIERDALGIPTIRGQSDLDRAFAMGFLHAQERFFQMDVLRRAAAGELAALAGPAAVAMDKQSRVHQFRKKAARLLEIASPADREALDRYASGVNQGLQALASKPIEYHILGAEPVPWKPEDSPLAVFAMFIDLQGRDYLDEQARLIVHQTLPPTLAEFLTPKGTEEWDAPIEGDPIPCPPVPPSESVDLRKKNEVAWHSIPDRSTADDMESMKLGSNNWAVAGSHTKHGGAIVANDMHLGLRVPNIWYRASFVLPPEDSPTGKDMTVTGVTLPGAPAIVVGSNTFIAWGFTNSEGDWNDLVIVEEEKPGVYQTPDGPKEIEKVVEKIEVKGGETQDLEISMTIWGPILAKDAKGRPLAWRWVAHDEDGANLVAAHMMKQTTLEDALAFAPRCGNPAQNFTVADNQGRIAWTIMGRIPKREGFDGWLPVSWADGKSRWTGYLEPENYPKVVSPDSGRIWTANSRVAGGENLQKMGFGGYDLGARQKQIRDDLLKLEKADEKDLLGVQLDDRALFWERWRELAVKHLDDAANDDKPLRKEARTFLEKWDGIASIDSVGYRLIRQIHLEITRRVLESLTHPCREASADFKVSYLPKSIEGPVWRLVDQKPMHLLHPDYESWESLILTSIDQVLEEATVKGAKPLADYRWGDFNTLDIRHPLSSGLRDTMGDHFADQFALDMPREPISGAAANIPKITRPSSGASERLVVSPGREKEGIFHMPTGQSGHFMSPFYRAGHEDWVKGNPSPFLPGPTVHTLQLTPGGSQRP